MPHNESSKPCSLPLQQLQEITNNFSDKQIIGHGAFGVVYKGVQKKGEIIAVKKLKPFPDASQKQFENEVCHLMGLKHPNIVQLVGYCYEKKHECLEHSGKYVLAERVERLLCLEYMPRGSLDLYISAADDSSGLDWNTRYKIIEGICYGLNYLHEKIDGPITHLDLKPANILLDNDMLPKISDFGLSRLLDQRQTISTSTFHGTLGYMAPEYMHNGKISPKSDVFSMGVIILEVITGHREYPYSFYCEDITTSSEEFIELEVKKWRDTFKKAVPYKEKTRKRKKAVGYTSPEITCQQITRCIKIGLSCVKSDRTKRPTTTKVIEMLHGFARMDYNVINEVTSPADQARWLIEKFAIGNLKELLIACARAVEENDSYTCDMMFPELRKMVSILGEPFQRLGAYMLEGLVARLSSAGYLLYRSLKPKRPSSSDLPSYTHVLYEACPYFKLGCMSANGAIAQAVKEEDKVHIIDFGICQCAQWTSLLQELAGRPGGPPTVRITCLDPMPGYGRIGGLDIVGTRLSQTADACKVPFEFHEIVVSADEVEAGHLGVIPGEAVAVNFTMELHHVPDETVNTANHRDRILRLVKSLSPKVLTLVEQESHTNTTPFAQRFAETLDYYTAIFESIDLTLPRDDRVRINFEQHSLARDIVNIVACEGAERVERHEVFSKWKERLMMAGFRPSALCSKVNTAVREMLQSHTEKYLITESYGVLYLGWKDRPLVVSSAWH